MSRHARHDRIMDGLRSLQEDKRILWWKFDNSYGGVFVWYVDTGDETTKYTTREVEAFLLGVYTAQKETG